MQIIKKIACTFAGGLSAVALLILTSFVPPLFKDVMELVNSGAEINSTAIVVFIYLAILGFAMYLFGHIFKAFNKKVSKYFESMFE